MNDEQWERLVRRLEPKAREDPRAYGRKVALLASFGYAFLAFSILVLIALGALVVYLAIVGPGALLKFLLPIGALALVIVRSLAVRLDPPGGVPLERNDSPELFRMIDEVNEKVEGPKIRQVLLDGALNAGVVQIPRVGGLLGQRNYLVIGLPLLQALTPEEFRAVIAHELGHLSKNHGRFGAWIYRVRVTWWQLLQALQEQRHWGTGIFRRFFEWYSPYFAAYSFPLMRAHEFEADEAAADAAGPRPAGTSLVSLGFAARYLDEEYWPQIYDGVRHEREPPQTAFLPMRERLPAAKMHRSTKDWFAAELARPADVADTHPSLADRLGHLGLDPDDVYRAATSNGASTRENAAQAYLGDREADLATALDRTWRGSIADEWRRRHDATKEAERELADLDERAGRETLAFEDAFARAALTEDLRSPDEALPLYRELLTREPEHPPANFAVGRIMLQHGSEEGLAHLDRAMAADPDALLPGCQIAYAFLKERERDEEAERYRAHAEGRYTALEAARAERAEVQLRGELRPHDLPANVVEDVRRELASFPQIARAYLVRRRMEHLDDEFPQYVLFVLPKRRPWRPLGGDRTKLVEAVSELELPFPSWIVSPGGFSLQPLELRRVTGAEIYRG